MNNSSSINPQIKLMPETMNPLERFVRRYFLERTVYKPNEAEDKREMMIPCQFKT